MSPSTSDACVCEASAGGVLGCVCYCLVCMWPGFLPTGGLLLRGWRFSLQLVGWTSRWPAVGWWPTRWCSPSCRLHWCVLPHLPPLQRQSSMAWPASAPRQGSSCSRGADHEELVVVCDQLLRLAVDVLSQRVWRRLRGREVHPKYSLRCAVSLCCCWPESGRLGW